MSRRSKRSRGLSDGTKGILYGAVGLSILAFLFGGYFYLKQSRPQLDTVTNCPKSGPIAIHAILFDRSDPISEQQAQRIRQSIGKFKDSAPFGLRFDLYTFEGDTKRELVPKLRLCALGKPGEANQWIENPERIRRSYETRFASVLDQTVSELLLASRENNSPIIESLRAAAITSFGPVEPGRIPLRVTMISDMIQHTHANSHFQQEPNFQQLSRQSVWATLQPQLKGAEIDILYLLRLTAQRRGTAIQTRAHQLFWEQLIGASGGNLTTIDPL